MRHDSVLGIVLLFALIVPIRADARIPAEPSQTIAMPGVEGRIDHLAVDVKGQRLFVAALGNNTVEVIDLAGGKRVHSISGLREPQGIAYISRSNRIVVACGGDGSCRVFDGQTYRQTAVIDCKSDADNVRCDATAGRLYVGCGNGALAVIDLERGSQIASIPLPGHPESFQLEANGKRVFVNVPAARQIAVIDREKQAVVASWPVDKAEANFPMALDETHHRLLVGCRKPARLLAIDTETGKRVAFLSCVADTDDLFYDTKLKQVYLSGGGGSISVIAQMDADRYRSVDTIPTATGARTSLFVPAASSLYLAVPHLGSQEAKIWVYKLGEP